MLFILKNECKNVIIDGDTTLNTYVRKNISFTYDKMSLKGKQKYECV